MSALVLVLPLLCLFSFILRLAFRNAPPRTKFAWSAFLNSLLTISGIVTTLVFVLVLSLSPQPSIVSSGVSDLDQRDEFVRLPAEKAMSSTEIATNMKPLVVMVSPSSGGWFRPVGIFRALGAGMLLQADKSGYLFATARHVVDGENWRVGKPQNDLQVASLSGVWGKGVVVARHKTKDVALFWVDRHFGASEFHQAIAAPQQVSEGEQVWVIGHPEGLSYTISNGLISRLPEEGGIQISAPVSPGNSGGPVYDDRGNLLGIVSSKIDRSIMPNAENLNFAVRADVLLDESGWNFVGKGKERFEAFRKAEASPSGSNAKPATPSSSQGKK
jgi:S1-C subfamily serine protease